jgi:hypothetical protein
MKKYFPIIPRPLENFPAPLLNSPLFSSKSQVEEKSDAPPNKVWRKVGDRLTPEQIKILDKKDKEIEEDLKHFSAY